MTVLTRTTEELGADVDRAGTARWVVRSSSGSFADEPFEDSVAGTRLLSDQMKRLAAFTLPFTLVASAYVPANVVEVVHRYHPTTSTRTTVSAGPRVSADAEWRYLPETVTRAEVEELQRIWALPYPGDHEFEFRESE